MNDSTLTNLDFFCMKTAQEMMGCQGNPSDKENLATKALGVLLENGPYGLMLYFETTGQNQRQVAQHYRKNLLALCGEERIRRYIGSDSTISVSDFDELTQWFRGVAQNLDGYLFIKQLWQQSLTYARYHAKALEVDSGSESSGTQS